MSQVQLRRYEIEADRLDAFIAWWPSIVEPREQFGFKVIFAFCDREHNEFVWALQHDGDFSLAEKQYFESAERAEAFAHSPGGVKVQHLVMVEPIYGV